MKKLLVKAEYIIQPYQAPVDAQPEKWVKDAIEVFTQPENVEEYVYHPAIEAQPELLELKEIKVIDQTQGQDDELAIWLAGNTHKYPSNYFVEYVDISAQVEQEKINSEALSYLASTDWMIVREVETQVPCPREVKQLRAEARLRVVK